MSNNTDDIVTRLRAWASHPPSLRGTPLALAAMDAANEIERLQGREELLRSVIDDQLAEIERLRGALRSAAAIPHGCSTGFFPCWCEAAHRG